MACLCFVQGAKPVPHGMCVASGFRGKLVHLGEPFGHAPFRGAQHGLREISLQGRTLFRGVERILPKVAPLKECLCAPRKGNMVFVCANSSISAVRPPCYPFLEEIVILGVIYWTDHPFTAVETAPK